MTPGLPVDAGRPARVPCIGSPFLASLFFPLTTSHRRSSVDQAMQNPSSYYAVPKCNRRIWVDWSHPDRFANSSWSSSTSTTLDDEAQSAELQDMREVRLPVCFTLTPPTPDAMDDDFSSSLDSVSELDEMPEIPFVSSATLTYGDGWITEDHNHQPVKSDSDSERSFWSSVIRMSPSKSSDKSIAVLGSTSDRGVVAPPRPVRQRSGSVSSTTSSRSKPAPAKSILSSGTSIKTKTRRSPPSVKFLDMPTIHYEDEFEPESPVASIAPVAEKEERTRFSLFRWLFGSTKAPAAPERPAISGPFPLWETPPRQRQVYGDGACSLRSVKSSSSLRSVRSYSSRLQTYWDRMTHKDP